MNRIAPLVVLVSVYCVSGAVPPVPETPARVDRILAVVPFVLEEGYHYGWSADRPFVETGYLLVLEVRDKRLLYPRATANPVLYVGDRPAERLNVGYESGRVVVIAPSTHHRSETGHLNLKLARFWFGTPALPELLRAAQIVRESDRAVEHGIEPFDPEHIARAQRDRTAITCRNKAVLIRHAAALVERYSPEEAAWARELARSAPLPEHSRGEMPHD